MLNVIMLSVANKSMLSGIVLNVVMLNIVMQNVVAPCLELLAELYSKDKFLNLTVNTMM